MVPKKREEKSQAKNSESSLSLLVCCVVLKTFLQLNSTPSTQLNSKEFLTFLLIFLELGGVVGWRPFFNSTPPPQHAKPVVLCCLALCSLLLLCCVVLFCEVRIRVGVLGLGLVVFILSCLVFLFLCCVSYVLLFSCLVLSCLVLSFTPPPILNANARSPHHFCCCLVLSSECSLALCGLV